MPTVLITGWSEGLRKVSMTRLLQAELDLRLDTAKACTDRVLSGEQVELALSTVDAAAALIDALEALGAHASLGGGVGRDAIGRLLDELCERLGFCLPQVMRHDLSRVPPRSAAEFAAAVCRAEGIELESIAPHVRRQLLDRIQNTFDDAQRDQAS